MHRQAELADQRLAWRMAVDRPADTVDSDALSSRAWRDSDMVAVDHHPHSEAVHLRYRLGETFSARRRCAVEHGVSRASNAIAPPLQRRERRGCPGIFPACS